MLERMWRKRNPLTLLVGMQTSTATVWRFPWKTGNRTAIWLSNPTAGHIHWGNQNWDTCTPMFIAALFIIARTWKQPRCPSADEWIRKLWYIFSLYLYWSYICTGNNRISPKLALFCFQQVTELLFRDSRTKLQVMQLKHTRQRQFLLQTIPRTKITPFLPLWSEFTPLE